MATNQNYINLGLKKNITEKNLRKKYLEIARMYHPDRHVGEEAKYTPLFQKMMNAHNRIKKSLNSRMPNRSNNGSNSSSNNGANNVFNEPGSQQLGQRPTVPKPTVPKPTGPKPWEAASVFGNMSPNYATVTTLEGRPEVDPLNINLASRSSIYKGKNVKPSPYVMFNPESKNPFYANMWLNDEHKNAARLSGVKPENIVNRYKYQRKIAPQYAAATAYNLRQAELKYAAATAAIKKAQEEESIRKGAKYLDAKAEQARLNKAARNAAEAARQARNLKRTAKANAGLKKPFWKFWGGSTRRHRR